MMKLLSQFEQVDSATPFARREDGKISAKTINKRLQRGVYLARELTGWHCPWDRSPGGSETQHVEEEESDTGPTLCVVGWPVLVEQTDQNGDDDMGYRHENRSR